RRNRRRVVCSPRTRSAASFVRVRMRWRRPDRGRVIRQRSGPSRAIRTGSGARQQRSAWRSPVASRVSGSRPFQRRHDASRRTLAKDNRNAKFCDWLPEFAPITAPAAENPPRRTSPRRDDLCRYFEKRGRATLPRAAVLALVTERAKTPRERPGWAFGQLSQKPRSWFFRDRRRPSRLPHVPEQSSIVTKPRHASVGVAHEALPDAVCLPGRVEREHEVVAVEGQAGLLDGGRGRGRREVGRRARLRLRHVELAPVAPKLDQSVEHRTVRSDRRTAAEALERG